MKKKTKQFLMIKIIICIRTVVEIWRDGSGLWTRNGERILLPYRTSYINIVKLIIVK